MSTTSPPVSSSRPSQDCGDLSAVNQSNAAEKNQQLGAAAPAPNIASGKGFPVSKFSPTLGKVVLDGVTGTAKVRLENEGVVRPRPWKRDYESVKKVPSPYLHQSDIRRSTCTAVCIMMMNRVA